MKRQKHTQPPPGVKIDYTSVYSVGYSGPVTKDNAKEILFAELNPRLEKLQSSVELSLQFLHENGLLDQLSMVYVALHQIMRLYPMTQGNWHSGERIPLVSAEEVLPYSIIFAFQGNYKTAFVILREFLELTVLQLYFYERQDKEEVGAWGRDEIRTPGFKNMMSVLEANPLFSMADSEFRIKDNLLKTYDELGGFIHTRGIPYTTMGLTGNNVNEFSSDALMKYNGYFNDLAHNVILLLAAYFPTSVIALPIFEKLGYWYPNWIPKKEKVAAIQANLSASELKILENISEHNIWYQKLKLKVLSLPDLTDEKIASTYKEFEELYNKGGGYFLTKLKEKNEILEV